MAQRNTIEIWSATFGGRRSFDIEIKSAKEIGAKWESDGHQRNVVLDQIPGWLEPLWGSDQSWLYLRRPEGVWKAKIPPEFTGETPIFLCQRLADDIVGMLSLGRSITGHKGWIRGNRVNAPLDAADRDAESRPEAQGVQVDADLIGSAWGSLRGEDGGKLLVDGGEHFNASPLFHLEGEWLVATDTKSGRRVAYPMHGHRAYRQALEAGNLGLQLGGKWTRSIKVRVDIRS